MNTSILEKANQVHAEIKKVDRAIEYFIEVCEEVAGNGIDHDEALARFFTEHRNVDERYMTFTLKGCHFCCWYATIEACERTQIDSIGQAFYESTIVDDLVCEWENVDWSWEYGRVLWD